MAKDELPKAIICGVCERVLRAHCAHNDTCSWMTCGRHTTRMTDGHVSGTPFPTLDNRDK